MRTSGFRAALLVALSVWTGCTYILGLEGTSLEEGAGASGGSGGAGGDGGGSTTTGPSAGGGGNGGSGGCADCPTDLAQNQNNPAEIVVQGGRVYWINGMSTAMMVDDGGVSEPEQLFQRSGLTKLAVSSANIYALVGDTIEQGSSEMPSEPTPVGAIANAADLAADDTTFYWFSTATTNISQGESVLLVSSQNALREMIVDRTQGVLFWITDTVLGRVDTAGGNQQLLRANLTVNETRLAFDADNVYWYDDGADEIRYNVRDTANSGDVLVAGVPDAVDLAAIAGDVYWIEGGAVMKWEGVSSMRSTLFPNANATSIDVDGASVYWTTAGATGRVMKGAR